MGFGTAWSSWLHNWGPDVFWLWVLTGFSSATAAVTGVGWAVTATRLHNTRYWHKQELKAVQHAHSFHRCPEHADTSLFNAPEHWERVRDLSEIGRRNRDLYQNRRD